MADVIRWFPLDRRPELDQAIAAGTRSSKRATRRDSIAVALGLCGLRVGEVIRLQVADFFAAGRLLEVRTLKGGRDRQIPLDGSLVELIERQLATRTQQSDLLLCNCRGGPVHHAQFQRRAHEIFDELLGPNRLVFHSLRHTFAMQAYALTQDPFFVRDLLGHRSVRTTETFYARSVRSFPPQLLVKLGGSGEAAPDPTSTPGGAVDLERVTRDLAHIVEALQGQASEQAARKSAQVLAGQLSRSLRIVSPHKAAG